MKLSEFFGAVPAALTGGNPGRAALMTAATLPFFLGGPAGLAALVSKGATAGAAGAGAGTGAGWTSLLKTAAVNAGTNAAIQSAMPQYGATTPLQPPPLTQLSDPMMQLQQLMKMKGGLS